MSAVKKFSHDGKKFDIIFLDPPYSKNLVVELLDFIVKNDIIKNDSIIVAEKDKDDPVPESVGTLKLVREQRYGDTVLVFYRPICD